MSKKKQRINYLVGIYNVINSAQKGVDDKSGNLVYKDVDIKQVLATVRYLLKEDGITPM